MVFFIHISSPLLNGCNLIQLAFVLLVEAPCKAFPAYIKKKYVYKCMYEGVCSTPCIILTTKWWFRPILATKRLGGS